MARSGVSQVQIDRMRQNILDWGNVVAPTFKKRGRPQKFDESMEVELFTYLTDHPTVSLAEMVQFLSDRFNGMKITEINVKHVLQRRGWTGKKVSP